MLDLIKRKFITFLVLLTAIVIVISLIVSSVFGGNGKADFLSNTFSVVISPLQGSLSWVTGNISDVFSFLGQITTSYNENKELKKQVLTLQRDIENIQEYKDENTRLRNLLDLQSQLTNYQTISADVVARDISGHSGIIKINKGSNHGIAKNDIIMSAGGLVGYVSEVGSTWASVTTITSSASHVSCTLPRIGEITLLSGGYSEYENGICSMDFITSQSAIAIGDSVETSGEGDIYPSGLFVGRVDSITDGKNGVSKKATVKTSADIRTLREVLVIKTTTN